MKKIQIPLMVVFLLSCISTYSQDLDKTITNYGEDNAIKYLQPLADAFGANLNSGLQRSAQISKFGFHFNLSLQAMYSPLAEGKKNFTPVGEDMKVPTVFGKESTDEDYPDGLWNTDFFPLAVPQLTIGSLMGTEVTIRYFAFKNKEIGEITLYGWGIRHSISQYILLCPVDIAAGFFHQKFSIGSSIEATALYYGIQISKQFSVLILYAGVGWEKATLKLDYEYEDTNVSFDLNGENKTRMTIGAGLDFKYVKLYLDFNLAPQNVISASIGFGL